jgi:hypothetical protein
VRYELQNHCAYAFALTHIIHETKIPLRVRFHVSIITFPELHLRRKSMNAATQCSFVPEVMKSLLAWEYIGFV